MSITAKELAAQLGLSQTAVSMALNNKAGVSRQTRDMIIKEAEKAGYDFSKLSLKKNKAGHIYCVIYRTHNAILNYLPIFSEIIEGVELECRQHDYLLRTMQIYEKTDDLQNILSQLRIADCAGILLLGTEITKDVCKQFLSLSVPVVLLDTYFDALDCSSVLINNAQGAYQATSYLIERTGAQPGHLASAYAIENFKERKAGFRKAIRDHGYSVGNSIEHELAPSIDGALTDMLEIIDRGDALAKCYFADNDLIAIGAIRAMKLRNIRVPEDISVIGFDNIAEAKVVEPSLSTIDIPRRYMGQTAARQLLYQIQNPVPRTVKIQVSTSLVKRFSVSGAE